MLKISQMNVEPHVFDLNCSVGCFCYAVLWDKVSPGNSVIKHASRRKVFDVRKLYLFAAEERVELSAAKCVCAGHKSADAYRRWPRKRVSKVLGFHQA